MTPLAGGVASFAGPDSPFNKVAGLGFGGVPGDGDLDQLERAFAGYGAPVQVELCHLADPEVGNLLTGRGYRLVSYENVLGRALNDAPGPEVKGAPPGVEVRLSAADELQAWLDVVIEAELEPDTQGLPAAEFPARPWSTPNAISSPPQAPASTWRGGTGSRPAAPASASPGASPSSLARPPSRPTAGAASRPRCWPSGSPTRPPRAAISRSSPPRRGPDPSRTRSARASTCSTPGRSWFGSKAWSGSNVAPHADPRPPVQAERVLMLAHLPQPGPGRRHGRAGPGPGRGGHWPDRSTAARRAGTRRARPP